LTIKIGHQIVLLPKFSHKLKKKQRFATLQQNYLTTEVCAIEIMSPTCVSDSTIMLSISKVQTLMSIVVNWPWGLKFACQLLQLEFSKCKKLVAPVGNKFQS
jgi:hypothetical protein